MYQKLWLGENRPYFLGNILARYDEELGRWDSATSVLRRTRMNYDRRLLPSLGDSPRTRWPNEGVAVPPTTLSRRS